MAQAARERFAKKNEAEDLRRAFEKLDIKNDGKIDCDELNTVFQMLNHKTKKVVVLTLDYSPSCMNAQSFSTV